MKRRNALKLGLLGLVAVSSPLIASRNEYYERDEEYERYEKDDYKKYKDKYETYYETNPYKKYRDNIVNRNFYKKDPKNPTKAELKHTPDIRIGTTDKNGYTLVEIIVGQEGIIHPSTKNHWIDFIELRADGKRVGITFFEPGKAMGYTAFKVKLNGVKTLTAVEGCNIHGIWEETITL